MNHIEHRGASLGREITVRNVVLGELRRGSPHLVAATERGPPVLAVTERGPPDLAATERGPPDLAATERGPPVLAVADKKVVTTWEV